MRPKEKHCHLFIQGPKVKKKKKSTKNLNTVKTLEVLLFTNKQIKTDQNVLTQHTCVAGI